MGKVKKWVVYFVAAQIRTQQRTLDLGSGHCMAVDLISPAEWEIVEAIQGLKAPSGAQVPIGTIIYTLQRNDESRSSQSVIRELESLATKGLLEKRGASFFVRGDLLRVARSEISTDSHVQQTFGPVISVFSRVGDARVSTNIDDRIGMQPKSRAIEVFKWIWRELLKLFGIKTTKN